MKNLVVIICLCILSNLSAQTNKFNLTFVQGDMVYPTYSHTKWELEGKPVVLSLMDLDWSGVFGDNAFDRLVINDLVTNIKYSTPIIKGLKFNIYNKSYELVHFAPAKGDTLELKELIPFQKDLPGLQKELPDMKRFGALKGTWDEVLADFKQERYDYYYINIWGTFCAPCLEHAPYLFDFEQFNVKVINICAEDDVEKVKKALASHPMPGYHFYTSRKEVESWGFIKGYPSYVLLDKKGEIIRTNKLGEAVPDATLNGFYFEQQRKLDTLNVLVLGNSYVADDTIVDCLKTLCLQKKKYLNVDKFSIGGGFLADHFVVRPTMDVPNPTQEAPVISLLKSNKPYDYALLIPGGYNEEAYVQLQKLLGKRKPKIIDYLGGGTYFWSKALQAKEYQDQLTKMKALVKRFGINYIDAGHAFQWVVDNELMVCTPFDNTLHHTLCGKKIIAVLLFEKMFGPVEPTELESIFTPSERRLMLGMQKYLSLGH